MEKKLIAIIDGLGWEILKECHADLFGFPYANSVDTVLGFSSSAIPTILTGMMPDQHGYGNLFYKSANTSFPVFQSLRKLPKGLINQKVLRKSLLWLNKKVTHFEGYYQAYDFPSENLGDIAICENKNIYSKGGLATPQNLIDHVLNSGGVVYSYKDQTNDATIFQKVKQTLLHSKVETVFAYFCEYDAFGHRHATDPKKMIEQAKWYLQQLSDLVKTSAQTNVELKVEVFSDHGMVPLKSTFNIFKHLDQKWPHWKSELFLIADSTMLRVYGDETNIDHLIEITQNVPGHWLTKEEENLYGVNFKQKYGDRLFVIENGWQFSPSHMGKTPCQGMHGYLPESPNMQASHFSNTKHKERPKHIAQIYKYLTKGHL